MLRFSKNNIRDSEAFRVGKKALDRVADNQRELKSISKRLCKSCRKKAKKMILKKSFPGDPCEECKPLLERAQRIGEKMNIEELVNK